MLFRSQIIGVNFRPNLLDLTNLTELTIFLESKSKILFLDFSFHQIWSYNCFDNDEIHSPFFLDGYLYWCRSNWNGVVRASIDSKLKDIEKIILNYDGYTRGLFLYDKNIVLGTSSNRHKENSNCQANLNHAVLHFYDQSFMIKNKIDIIEEKEIYDILVI